MTEGVDNKTRLEILRLIAEMPNPVGGNVLMLRLNQHGIDIGLDGVRYHLRVLDEKGLTRRISTRAGFTGWAGELELTGDTRHRLRLAGLGLWPTGHVRLQGRHRMPLVR